MKKLLLLVLAIFLQVFILAGHTAPATGSENNTHDFKIRFSFTEEISKAPVSGRIIIGFHANPAKPINNPDLFDPQPTFAWEVRDWKPGEAFIVDGANAVSWMGKMDSLNGWYGEQAVLKINRTAR